MGDPKRFDVFADFVARRWPDRELRIADVAGGKGGLHAALYRRGYRDVVSFDKRRNRANPARSHYRYRLFGEDVEGPFDLILGLHPDEATDVAICYANRRQLPFAVVPCCVKPTVWPFDPKAHRRPETAWLVHLFARAGTGADHAPLPMRGASTVIYNDRKVGSERG